MIDKFRIVQKGPEDFTVQEKGWFFWWQASYWFSEAGDMPLHFRTQEKARAWIAETIKIRHEKRVRDSFKSRIVE